MSKRLKKSLGQHFLIDEGITVDIAHAIEVPDDYQLIEVGPGGGALTKHLYKKFNERLILIEKDDRLVEELRSKYPQAIIIHKDFLNVNLSEVTTGKYNLIGNFPYNISTQIIFQILESGRKPNQVVGMFQKEVAKRIASPPGKKDYGITSVLTQYFYDVEYLFDVPKVAFKPPPNVVSGVIRLNLKPSIEPRFFPSLKKIVKQCFGLRRKMLRNSLKIYFDETQLGEFSNKRPEQISMTEFVNLSKKL